MKLIRVRIHRLSAVHIAVILLVFSLFSGVFFANIFQDYYRAQMQHYAESVFSNISTMKINYFSLFTFVLKKNFKEFAIFWLLSITILGIPYMAFKIAFFGFSTGFFISAITMQYGFKGILLIIAYVFPQGIIYLAVSLICLYKGFSICRSMYYENKSQFDNKLKLIAPELLPIFLLALAILVGSFIEAYAGAFILRKTLVLFS